MAIETVPEPYVAESHAPLFHPGDRVRSNVSGELGSFMRINSYGHAEVAFDDDLYLGEQVIDTVETHSIDLLSSSPIVVDGPRWEDVRAAEHARLNADLRAAGSVPEMVDDVYAGIMQAGDGDVEWAAPEGGASR